MALSALVLAAGMLLAGQGFGQRPSQPQTPPAPAAKKRTIPARKPAPLPSAPVTPPPTETTTPPARQDLPPPASVPPPWEARQIIERLRPPMQHLEAAVSRVQPQNWEGPGAANYVAIRESVLKQVRGLAEAIDVMAQQPDRPSLLIRFFIALYQVVQPLDTLSRGANQFRAYAHAHEIEDATNALVNARGELVSYLLELSQFLETSNVTNQRELEACREQLWRRAPERPRPRK